MDNEDDITPALGRRIRAIRRRRGMSQQDLADASDLTVEAVSRLERAMREPRIGTLARVAGGLGVSLSHLVDVETPSAGRELSSKRRRAEVEQLAELLDDKPANRVRFIIRFAELYLEKK